MQGVFVAYFAG
jgi:hypothetical protein